MRKNKENNGESKVARAGMLDFFSFVALIIMAVLMFFDELPFIDLSEKLAQILTTVSYVLVLIVVGLSAWKFAKNKGKGIRITFLIAILVFIASIVFIWIK